MTTALPRPSRPSNGPPNMALPALPVAKTRKSLGNLPTPTTPAKSGIAVPSIPTSTSSIPARPFTPKTTLRATSQHFGPPTPAPTSALPLPRPKGLGLPVPTTPARTLRKSISIQSFPQPPRTEQRVSSLPPSPLPVVKSLSARRPKATKDIPHSAYTNVSTPSLLNGTGEGKSIGIRTSDGLTSIGSPPHSRSSSAQESYSTSATTYDDPAEGMSPKIDAGGAASTSTSEKRSSKSDGKGNVLVSVRVRPDTSSGKDGVEGDWAVDGRQAQISYRGKEGGDHQYDNVFTKSDNNARVYDHIAKRLVRRVMEGYHGTVFAYGMTGTGKTFSMQGTASSPGVIPLAITDIFSYIRETPSREFLLRVSYLEIYNEKIHDLLSMPTASAVGGAAPLEEIKLREDAKRGVYATPLKEEIVQSPTQLLRVIARGDLARRTASTQFNARSSRSHAVVQIVVESRERLPGTATDLSGKRSAIPPGGVRVSTLSLIDLAGSEKAAETKERRQEGAHINKSLLTLGTVIARLSERKDKGDKATDKDGKHLPYRDSKLTRLLQGALSGNSLISILCTIQIGAHGTPASTNTHVTETLSTLKFASRAKNSIVSHAKKAEEALGAGGEGGARVLLERYRMEIMELRTQLDTKSKRKTSEEVDLDKERDEEEERVREQELTERREEQMVEMQLARTALKERIEHLNRLILSSKSIGVNTNGSLSSLGQYARFSQVSLAGSIRSSMTTPCANPSLLDRTASIASASTIGMRSSNTPRIPIEADVVAEVQEDIVGDFTDGTATLTAQNQALQSDLADKNRYIATLERRLLQARRTSSSRTSVGLSAPSKAIMVGEDHSVSAVLKDKDTEIAELRARLDDKDRMLAALRSAARSRDVADAYGEHRLSQESQKSAGSGPPVTSPAIPNRRRTRSVDEMNKMLEEMIQDRVDSGQIVRNQRGSVRLPSGHKLESSDEEVKAMQPLRRTPSPTSPIAADAPMEAPVATAVEAVSA